MYNLGRALHSFIQWPRDSIVIIQKDKRPLTKPLSVSTQEPPVLGDQVVTQNSDYLQNFTRTMQKDKRPLTKPPSVSTEVAPILGNQVHQRKSCQTVQKVVILKKLEGRLMIQSLYKNFISYNILEPFNVVSEPGIFSVESFETFISSEVIVDMLNNEQLDISCIMWYQMMLHSLMLTSRGENKCGFINPLEITSKQCARDDEDKTNHVIKHLVDVMNFHQDKQFFLAPYWQGFPWMLFVICPHQWKGYILDSAQGSKTVKHYMIIKHVQKAVAMFKKKN